MATLRKTAKAALRRGRNSARSRIRSVSVFAKTTAQKAFKAATRAAGAVTALEVVKGVRKSRSTVAARRKRKKIAAAVVGAAALTAAGVAVARSRSSR
jgi:hypothetical protein